MVRLGGVRNGLAGKPGSVQQWYASASRGQTTLGMVSLFNNLWSLFMNEAAKQELELIRSENGGFLRPADVVNYARDDKSALHEYFEWDDSAAAEKYRLAQARALIRVAVVVEPRTSEKLRAYVSLTSDRSAEGGYRAIADIINDEVLKETLIADAMKDLASFTRKYEKIKRVTEFSGLFQTIEDVVRYYREAEPQEESRPAA